MKKYLFVGLCVIFGLLKSQNSLHLTFTVKNTKELDRLDYSLFKEDSLVLKGTVRKEVSYGKADFDIYVDSIPYGFYAIILERKGEVFFRYADIRVRTKFHRVMVDIDKEKHGGVSDTSSFVLRWPGGSPEWTLELYNRWAFGKDSRVLFGHQLGMAGNNFYSLDSKRNFFLGGMFAFGMENTYLNCDTLIVGKKPNRERLSSVYMDVGLMFRTALNKDEDLKTTAFWDVGVNYSVPWSLSYNTYENGVKIRDSYYNQYAWNDWTIVSRLGWFEAAITLEYRLNNRLINQFPEMPRVSFGVSYIAPVNE